MSLSLLWNPRSSFSVLVALASLILVMLFSVPTSFAQASVPDTFLSEPKPVRVARGLGIASKPFIIGIDGRNATTGPIQLAKPVIGPLLNIEGDVSTQAATRS